MVSGFPSSASFIPWALIPVTAILTVIGTRKTLRGEYEQQLAEKQSKADKDTENFKQQWINLSNKFNAEKSRAEAALEENKVLQQQLNMLKEQLHSSK